MPEKKSEIFSLAFHHKFCITRFIRVGEKLGTIHTPHLSPEGTKKRYLEIGRIPGDEALND